MTALSSERSQEKCVVASCVTQTDQAATLAVAPLSSAPRCYYCGQREREEEREEKGGWGGGRRQCETEEDRERQGPGT